MSKIALVANWAKQHPSAEIELQGYVDQREALTAVISMGKSLHMGVVAEGVETREQPAFLREQSCPEGQGYYFSRAVVAEEFTQLLGAV